MTLRRLVTLMLAAGLLVFVAPPATLAQPGPGGRFGQGPRFAASPPIQALQLTEEQRTKLDALMSEVRTKAGPLRERVRSLRQQLRTELLADKPDEASLRQLRGDLAKAEQELMGLRLDQQTRFAQILTPEQRKLLRERREARALAGALRGFGFGPPMGRRGAFLGVGPGGVGFGPGARGRALLGPMGGRLAGPRRLVGRGFCGFGCWWR